MRHRIGGGHRRPEKHPHVACIYILEMGAQLKPLRELWESWNKLFMETSKLQAKGH